MFRLRPVQGGLGHGLLELRAHGRQERVGALLPHLQAEGPLPQQHGLASLGCCWGSFELAGRLRLRRSPDLPGARQRTYRPGESAEMHRQTSVPASLGAVEPGMILPACLSVETRFSELCQVPSCTARSGVRTSLLDASLVRCRDRWAAM